MVGLAMARGAASRGRSLSALVGLASVCSACASPASPASPHVEIAPATCAQREQLLRAVAGHPRAELEAARSACNAGCKRGCGVAAESALVGRTDARDVALAAALARQGCSAGEARSCFVEASAQQVITSGSNSGGPDRAIILPMYERACALGDVQACAWKLVYVPGSKAVAPGKLDCADPLLGQWIAAHEGVGELELHIAERDGAELRGTMTQRSYPGTSGHGVPAYCDDGASGGLPPAGVSGRDLDRLATLAARPLAARSTGASVEIDFADATWRLARCSVAHAGLQYPAIHADLEGANVLRGRTVEAPAKEWVFVRLACGAK